MNPLKLTMSAFGCYADVHTIDFAKLWGSGIYLITGETGAGKTTIFDAISFALFGKASGSSRDDYTMLRSDFADEKAKSFVELDFASGDKRYKVVRSIKKTGQDVNLTLSDGTVVSGDRNVRQKITEIVGLDRDQFAQIVMIAQNEFLLFLQSRTDERVKILRNIFGTETLKRFQEKLKELAKREDEKRNLLVHDFGRYGVDIYKREEQFAEWEIQIKNDGAELLDIEKALSEYDKAKQALAADIAVAEELAGKFADLAAFCVSLEKHSAGAGEMASVRVRASLGETALRRVKPLADEAARAAENHAASQSGLEIAKKQEASALAALEQARKTISELPPLDKANAEYATLLKEWEEAVKKLNRLKSLQAEYEGIAVKKDALAANREKYEEYSNSFKAINEKYKSLEESFLRNQAGILASGLADGEACPVCGSSDHPAPAVLSGDSISETDLRKAKRASDEAQEKRDSKSAECGKLTAETDTLVKRFSNDFSEFNPAAGAWESSGPELAEMLKRTLSETEGLALRKETGEKALNELASKWESTTIQRSDSEAAYKSAQTLVVERSENETKLFGLFNEAQAGYIEALKVQGFADTAGYAAALVSEVELKAMVEKVAEYEKNGERLTGEIARLERETAGKEAPDTGNLKAEAEKVKAESTMLGGKRDEVKSRLDKNRNALKELRCAATELEKVEKSYAAVKQLADAANGKLDFETYAQMAYFEHVLHSANIRLKLMSQNRFVLLRKEESSDKRTRTGLDLEVLDSYTGKKRPANSLSGGESFMAALSLALGLSDAVQQSAGGIHLDAMFIDEGFGSLDAEALDLAIRTLSEIAGSSRTIGIISHVSELRGCIDKQIRVEKTMNGSKITGFY